jgi:DNA-binding transcriptional ArsR family regulator
MQDVLFVEAAGQAGALLHPLRIEVLKRLAEPRSCPEIAKTLGETPQKIYYHVKILEASGLVDKVEERRVRGIMEGLYRARARSYWLSPHLVGRIGGADRARDRMSLGFLLTLAEQIQTDVARLGERTAEDLPSLGLSFQVALESRETRARFLSELTELFQGLALKYAAPADSRGSEKEDGETFQVSLVCYPKSHEKERTEP